MNFNTFFRALWPERGYVFAIVGGVIGAVGDVVGFLSNFAAPEILALVAGVLALAFGWFCFSLIGKAEAAQPAAGADPVRCRECDAFRIMLFSAIGFAALMLIGQGSTATERIGAQLGLIQRDVAEIREDTAAIREVTSPSELIRNPRSAADRYHNAWVYSLIRRDAEGAWRAVQDLYDRHTPNKIDAAQLYFDIGRPNMPRAQLLARMAEIGRRKRDAAMLVIVGRYTDDPDEAQTFYDEARAIDPDLAIAYWDIQRASQVRANLRQIGRDPRDQIPALEATVAQLDAFMAAAERKPLSSYYFLPQYAGDPEGPVRSMRESYQMQLDTMRTMAARLRDAGR